MQCRQKSESCRTPANSRPGSRSRTRGGLPYFRPHTVQVSQRRSYSALHHAGSSVRPLRAGLRPGIGALRRTGSFSKVPSRRLRGLPPLIASPPPSSIASRPDEVLILTVTCKPVEPVYRSCQSLGRYPELVASSPTVRAVLTHCGGIHSARRRRTRNSRRVLAVKNQEAW